MKHSECCNHVDPKKVTFKANNLAIARVKTVFLSWLGRCITRVEISLARTFTLNPDPYISEHRNRNGELYFRVYDPGQDVYHTFYSEESVYIWLEERHYR